LIFVTSTGGFGGFLASVRDWGATGQQQQACMDSEELAVRGGAGGFLRSLGGGTKPSSVDPSPAHSTVPVHKVAARAVRRSLVDVVFMRAVGFSFGL
jgi:hypothetical protein